MMDTLLSAAASRLSLAASDATSSLEVDGVLICCVDSVAGVKAAVASALESSGGGGGGGVALDLEGVDLGRTGRVATLQMCGTSGSQPSERSLSLTATTTVVFVIDIATLGDTAFAAETGLRSLLEGDAVKLFWDVRADAAALFHHFGVRVNPESVIDVQLLATVETVTKGKPMVSLPSLGGKFDAPGSVLTFAEKSRMKRLRNEARKLYLPQCGGSFAAWLGRPLSPVLLEYAADVRFFGRLRASLSQLEEQYSQPLKAAVQKRIAEAQAPTYSNDDHLSMVDPDFWSGIVESAPEAALKLRLTSVGSRGDGATPEPAAGAAHRAARYDQKHDARGTQPA
jgi:hypothetical protein